MLRPDKRNPPPPYQTTVVGNTTWDSASGSHISLQTGTNGFQSTAGSSAGFHSRAGDAGGRRGASEEAAMDMTDRLQSVQGVKVCNSGRSDTLMLPVYGTISTHARRDRVTPVSSLPSPSRMFALPMLDARLKAHIDLISASLSSPD